MGGKSMRRIYRRLAEICSRSLERAQCEAWRNPEGISSRNFLDRKINWQKWAEALHFARMQRRDKTSSIALSFINRAGSHNIETLCGKLSVNILSTVAASIDESVVWP